MAPLKTSVVTSYDQKNKNIHDKKSNDYFSVGVGPFEGFKMFEPGFKTMFNTMPYSFSFVTCFHLQYCMENKIGFLVRFLASGIFLDRFFGDFGGVFLGIVWDGLDCF